MKIIFAIVAATALLGTPALADDAIRLTLKDHKFTPAEIHVKANTPTVIAMTNEDTTAEEFDSTSLKVEKIVPLHGPVAPWTDLEPKTGNAVTRIFKR